MPKRPKKRPATKCRGDSCSTDRSLALKLRSIAMNGRSAVKVVEGSVYVWPAGFSEVSALTI